MLQQAREGGTLPIARRRGRSNSRPCLQTSCGGVGCPLPPTGFALYLFGTAGEGTVEEDRGQDRRAHHGLYPELVDAEEQHPILQHGENDGADGCAVYGAAATEDADAADDYCGDRLKVQLRRDDRIDRTKACSPEHADKTAQESGEHEHERYAARLADAENARALGIAAEGVEIAARAGETRCEADDEGDEERQPNEKRHADDMDTCYAFIVVG